MEFCQELSTTVPVPTARQVDHGWTVATCLWVERRTWWRVHERLLNSAHRPPPSAVRRPHEVIRLHGARMSDSRRRGGPHPEVVECAGSPTGWRPGKTARCPVGSLLKLFSATNVMRRYYRLASSWRARTRRAWPDTAASSARCPCGDRGLSLGGGSNEIQRNIISERLLACPVQYAADGEVPYRGAAGGEQGARIGCPVGGCPGRKRARPVWSLHLSARHLVSDDYDAFRNELRAG